MFRSLNKVRFWRLADVFWKYLTLKWEMLLGGWHWKKDFKEHWWFSKNNPDEWSVSGYLKPYDAPYANEVTPEFLGENCECGPFHGWSRYRPFSTWMELHWKTRKPVSMHLCMKITRKNIWRNQRKLIELDWNRFMFRAILHFVARRLAEIEYNVFILLIDAEKFFASRAVQVFSFFLSTWPHIVISRLRITES